MELIIIRRDDTWTSNELKDALEQLPNWDSSVELEIRSQQQHLRTIDPTVLVAGFTMAGTVLGALIGGLLQIIQSNKEKIVLVSKNGLHIEIEARHAQKKLPELIKLLKSMEVEIIQV